MSALGRGLASLIPKRYSEEARDTLEKIDSMEELQEQSSAPAPAEPTKTTKRDSTKRAKKQVNVIEEFEDLDEIETSPPPSKPLVTPLTIDPETGSLREASPAENAPTPGVIAANTRQAPAVIRPLAKQEETPTPSTAAIPPAPTPEPEPETTTPPSDEQVERAISDRHEERVEQIPLGDIEVNALQPRRSFNPDEMEDLTQSINQHGILQPLVVMRKAGGGFELIAGERRLRAAKKLGWEKVPCVVRLDVSTDRGRLEMALIENVQREDLNPIEEAMGYQRLHDEFGLTHEEIGTRVGRSRVGITNVLRVLQLPAEIQRGLAEGKISAGHARAILMIPDDEKQLRFYHHLLDESLTVRKAETRARRIQRLMKLSDPLRKKTRGRPQLSLKYDGRLEEKFGYNARVKFIEEKNRFEVVFQAFSEKEAEQLISRLLGDEPLPDSVDEDVVADDTAA